MSISIAFGSRTEPDALMLECLVDETVASRLFRSDATLWGESAEPEAVDRLGWTDFEDHALRLIPEIESLRRELMDAGISRVVLCGMGGSRLAPEVICHWSNVELTVLDSTHPGCVSEALTCDLARTVVVVSSKSGSTIDTRSHKAAFEAAFREAGLDIARHVVVVTDPGTELESTAHAAGQRVFQADPAVGGRYSALTAFGLVPSGLAGADIRQLVTEAQAVRSELSSDDAANPALRLAVALAQTLPERYILLMHPTADASWGLGAWIEQLVAESSGKEARGILPIALLQSSPENTTSLPISALGVTIQAGLNSESHTLSLPEPYELTVAAPLGAQLLLWEAATAVLGRLLSINPFDQPDVESAKIAARRRMDTVRLRPEAVSMLTDLPGVEVLADAGKSLESITDVAAWLRGTVSTGHYLSVQAYLHGDSAVSSLMEDLREVLFQSLGIPVTLDWGPSFLHSTGQFHKGGPPLGIFLQLVDQTEPDLAIPGVDTSFGELITAQALGDHEVLSHRGLPVVTLRSADPKTTIVALIAALSQHSA